MITFSALCARRTRNLLAAIALLIVVAAAGGVAQAASGQLTLTTRKAVVFKDGYALLIKDATGTADESGWVFTLDAPDTAVLGSFWATSADHEILAMRAEYTDDWKRLRAPTGAARNTLDKLLAQVVGKPVTLTLADGRRVRGTLIGRITIEGRPSVLIHRRTSHVDAQEPVTIAQSDIAAVHSPALSGDNEANPQFTRAKRLSFAMGRQQAGKPVKLTVMYFTTGIRWIPTYRISGELEDAAAMALQAEILNESEDLRSVALDLVVGVPHLRFRDTVSPLSLEGTLRNTLAQVAPQLMTQSMSNDTFTRRRGESRGRSPVTAGTANIELPAELAATGEQDLFVYSVDQFSLTTGGRATVPLWQASAPLRHLYTLDLSVTRNSEHGSIVDQPSDSNRSRAGSPLRLLRTRVWHQLELTNTSQVPWTTGAAMILRGDLPVGQDLLTYSPPGGTSLLPMTVAIDIRGTLREQETERKPNALNWGGHSYSRIRKTGVITLTSYRKETSDMRVSLALPGKAANPSADGEVRVNDYHAGDWSGRSYGINNHSDLTWQLQLDPGQTAELTYEVEFYVP